MKCPRITLRNLLLLSSIGAIILFAMTFPQAVHAKSMAPAAGCWGATCAGKDPTQMGCLASIHILPYKRQEYYQGNLIGYFSSVYSYTCNSNWNEAELTSYAVNQGWRVETRIETVDSNNLTEVVLFPGGGSEVTYGGETGWPTVSNMVDGTNRTTSTFYLWPAGTGGTLMSDQVSQ